MRLALSYAFLATAIFAQEPAAPKLAFEAASIKPSNTGRPGSGINIQAARIRVMNATLKFLVGFAWSVQDFQLSGATGWIDSERFDIDAVSEKPFQNGEARMMLQTLLADRFAVAVHRETSEKSGYALVVANKGPKLPKAEGDQSILFSRTPTGDTTLNATSISMAQFARALSSNLNAVVVDQTGLEGSFNASLQWTPDSSLRPLIGKNGEPLPPPPADSAGPSIFSALQEKLGLKLESKKVPMEIIVIEHADHPTGN
jgi:uncharacterized protein (TIGR03435 family)